jgi:hypothetical protein
MPTVGDGRCYSQRHKHVFAVTTRTGETKKKKKKEGRYKEASLKSKVINSSCHICRRRLQAFFYYNISYAFLSQPHKRKHKIQTRRKHKYKVPQTQTFHKHKHKTYHKAIHHRRAAVARAQTNTRAVRGIAVTARARKKRLWTIKASLILQTERKGTPTIASDA